MSIEIRVIHLVALVAALALAAGFGAGYGIGQKSPSEDSSPGLEAQLAEANQVLQGYRERAIAATAQSNVRVAIPSIEAYYADTGTYAGMTVEGLRTLYDPEIPGGVSVQMATDDSYCVEATVESASYHKTGPIAGVEEGPCPA